MSDANWHFLASNFKALTPKLDGSKHVNRMPKQQRKYVDIDTDCEIILKFLSKHQDSPDTFRSYVKEIYRLKLWAEKIKDKCVSSLTEADIEDYCAFATNPPTDWVGGVRNALRGTPNWRPFAAPLSRHACADS